MKSMKKTPSIFKSPDMSKLKEVVIDHRTRIFIAHDADPVEARDRFIAKFNYRISQPSLNQIGTISNINRLSRP